MHGYQGCVTEELEAIGSLSSHRTEWKEYFNNHIRSTNDQVTGMNFCTSFLVFIPVGGAGEGITQRASKDALLC